MDNVITEKECEICGVWFEQTSPLQKYCPDCRKNSDKKKRILYKNVSRNLRMYDIQDYSKGIDNECKHCGKHFISYKYAKRYCSKECEDASHIESTFCRSCGKPMLGSGDEHVIASHIWFCSEKCVEENKWKIARQNNEVKICPGCGKEHIKKGTYCCRECYEQSRKKSPVKPVEKRIEICTYCEKQFETISSGKEIQFCSDECKKKYWDRIKEERKAADQKFKQKNIAEMNDKLSKKEKEYIEKNGLCPMCRTSYRDCERMQSNFRLSPEGASFKGSVIVQCPKYTAPKTKRKTA